MNEKSAASLLGAYNMAVTSEQSGIAHMLEDVILGEMCRTVEPLPATRATPVYDYIVNPHSPIITLTNEES